MVLGGQPTPCVFYNRIREKQFFTLPVVVGSATSAAVGADVFCKFWVETKWRWLATQDHAKLAYGVLSNSLALVSSLSMDGGKLVFITSFSNNTSSQFPKRNISAELPQPFAGSIGYKTQQEFTLKQDLVFLFGQFSQTPEYPFYPKIATRYPIPEELFYPSPVYSKLVLRRTQNFGARLGCSLLQAMFLPYAFL